MDLAALSTGLENSEVKLKSSLLSVACRRRQATTTRAEVVVLIFTCSAMHGRERVKCS